VTPPARIATALAALLVLALAPAPADAKRSVPEQFMGMNWDGDIADAPEATQRRQFPRMAAAGVESLRVGFHWAFAQPAENGPIDLARTDALMRMASEHRIRVQPIVILAPEWARMTREPLSPPKDPQLIVPYTQALIARYGSKGSFWTENPTLPRLPITTWQYWNEPHLPYQWTLPPGPKWQPTYVDHLRVFYATVKEADPGAKVVLGAITNESWKYLEQLYKAGAGRFFDIATFHPYTAKEGGVVRIAQRFRAVMKRHNQARKPVWITEVGLPASRGRHPSDNRLQTTDKGMAKFLTATYADVAANRRKRSVRVTRVYWYTWASEYRGDLFRFTGLSRYRTGGEEQRKPAYGAYVRIARKLQGCTKTTAGRCESG
jgi:hypothetical protein